jgi:hypothetical protein
MMRIRIFLTKNSGLSVEGTVQELKIYQNKPFVMHSKNRVAVK